MGGCRACVVLLAWCQRQEPAVVGVYWEHKAGSAAVTAMEELSADISAS